MINWGEYWTWFNRTKWDELEEILEEKPKKDSLSGAAIVNGEKKAITPRDYDEIVKKQQEQYMQRCLPIVVTRLPNKEIAFPILDVSSSLIGVNSDGDPIKFIPMEISLKSPPFPFPCLSWDQYFLSIANVVKLRSKDAQTKVGAVIVNSDNRIVGTGYNSFPAGIDDSELPTTRPDKYPYMLHAEENGVCNLTTAERNLKLYCTGRPCKRCAKTLWNRGIRHWIIDPLKITMEDEEDKKVIDLLCKNGLVIEELECEYELIKKV